MQPYLVIKDLCLLLKGNSPGETTGSFLERWPARLIDTLPRQESTTYKAGTIGSPKGLPLPMLHKAHSIT